MCSPMWWAAWTSTSRPGTCRWRWRWRPACADVALPPDLVVFGELGLTGEVRPVTFGEERIREAAKLGYRRALVPAGQRAAPGRCEGIEVRGVARIEDAIRKAAGPAPL